MRSAHKQIKQWSPWSCKSFRALNVDVGVFWRSAIRDVSVGPKCAAHGVPVMVLPRPQAATKSAGKEHQFCNRRACSVLFLNATGAGEAMVVRSGLVWSKEMTSIFASIAS